MHSITECSFLHRKPSCLLTKTPYTQSKPNIFSHPGHIDWFNNPIPAPDAFEEGNMANISPTIKIDISIKSGVVEEITIGAACSPEEITTYKALFQEYRDIFSWSYTEMPGLDPSIVEHRIDTWPDITPVHQKNNVHYTHPKQRPSRPRLTNYALLGSSTPSPIRHGSPTPSLLTKNRALSMSVRTFTISITPVPKTTFQCPLSTKLSMIAPGHEALSFMDGFSGYNQIQIHPVDQYKTTFTTPWGTFAYRVMPFGLKNTDATFQRAMTYIFHDLAHIILTYLDDLTTRSKKHTQHLNDLRIIFQWCRQYNIRLNPLKCIFCITVGRLLGFIISQRGITVDPLKVQAITEIPPPQNLRQLQSLQGKANFLRCFVPDYATRAHGFLHLLRHDIPFQWDEHAQTTFDDLKVTLSNAPLISPPDYNHDYILYISASVHLSSRSSHPNRG
jgi:hypothetical protein